MTAIMVKKEEKVAAVFAALANKDDMSEFKKKFEEMYPKDWENIIQIYKKRREKYKTRENSSHAGAREAFGEHI